MSREDKYFDRARQKRILSDKIIFRAQDDSKRKNEQKYLSNMYSKIERYKANRTCIR